MLSALSAGSHSSEPRRAANYLSRWQLRSIRNRVETLAAALALHLLVSLPTVRAASEVPLETVHFVVYRDTVIGESVFVVGDRPELGSGDMRRGIKLIPGPATPNGLTWTIDIALPQGTAYSYRYAVRNDDVSQYSNPANGAYFSPPTSGATATPTPAIRDRVVYSMIGDGATLVTFTNLPYSINRALIPVNGYPDVRVAALFAWPNGPGIDCRVLANTFDTPLHAIMHRGGALYNYVPVSAASGGTIVEFALPTALIPATRTINGVTGRGIRVYLPRGYGTHTERDYPVLYMHDGQNVFLPGGAFGCWQAEVVLNDRIRRGRVRELIIVAVDNSPGRLPEYNPDWPGGATANANYNQFLVTELKPFIDAAYRTRVGPEDTGVMGSSFGGVASISVALAYPGVFGRIGALSTSFGYTSLDARLAAGELSPSVRFYLDAGDTSDGGEDTVVVRDQMLATGRVLEQNLFFQLGFGHQHNEAAWNARLPGALEALFPITDEDTRISLPRPTRTDLDGDGCVGLSDLTILLSTYGLCDGMAGFNPVGDVDANLCIDLADVAALLATFGECP